MKTKHTPGPWRVGYRAMDIVCDNMKIGGDAKLFDVRGWGYLTGTGHGALSLDADTAYAVQQANAALASAAPELLEVVQAFIAKIDPAILVEHDLAMSGLADEYLAALAVVAKATGGAE